MKTSVPVFCLIALLIACDSDDSDRRPEKESLSYLPLEVGNYWKFRSTGTITDLTIRHREVKAIVALNGRDYYLITTSHGEETQVDSAYYRVESNGDVHVFRPQTDLEELRYKLFANDGDSWTYPGLDDEVARMTVHVGTVNTGSTTIDNCKHYFFDMEDWADEEYTFSLAPGIGFIREVSYSWGGGIVLTEARISGHVTQYQ